MSGTEPPTSDGTDAEETPRTRRARTEPMDVWLLRAGGIYGIYSASGQQYRVDVATPSCTCPDWRDREPTGGCKHLRRVRQEIDAGTVPRPDGRLPVESSSPTTSESHSAGTTTNGHRISGPHVELDQTGLPTGATYYRCTCGREALRRGDLVAFGCGADEGT